MFKKPKTPIPKQEVQSTLASTIKTTLIYTVAFLVFGVITASLIDFFS